MSSWIVSRRHIDLLVTAILTHRPDTETDIAFGTVCATDAAKDADRIGQVLWAANHASVNYRYDEHAPTPAYHHTPTDPATLHSSSADRPSHAPTPRTPTETQVEEERILFLIKQVDCYTYQCADLPTWEVHPARAWTTALREHLIERLHALCPGVQARHTHAYQAAPWGIG